MNKLSLSNKAISIEVRDFFLNVSFFRCSVSFNKYFSLNCLSNIQLDHFGRVAENNSQKLFLYYQQGSKSLQENVLFHSKFYLENQMR